MRNTVEILRAVRAYARANYNTGGWDYVVETMSDDAELEDFLTDYRGRFPADAEEAIRFASVLLDAIDERRADVLAEAW